MVVGHLRHPLGADIAGDFNFFKARRLQTVNQLDLDGSGYGLLFILQAVTRADVDELDAGGEVVSHESFPIKNPPAKSGDFNFVSRSKRLRGSFYGSNRVWPFSNQAVSKP